MSLKEFMLKVFVLFILTQIFYVTTFAQSHFVKNLELGKPQTLVVYGTSLSSGDGGKAWVKTVTDQLNSKYEGRLKVYNSGKSAMWSTWGVQHLEDSLISKKPDVVLMEFSMNDAFLNYKTSLELAELNLNYTINRIKLFNPDCEIILQIMNIPLDAHAAQRPKLNSYYNLYRAVAKKRGILIIDHYPNWKKILDKGKDEYLKLVPDGIHPNEAAARSVIAPFILQKIFEKN